MAGGDDDIIIKIAADVSVAAAALTQLVGQMGEMLEAFKKVKEETKEGEESSKGFWDSLMTGFGETKSSAVEWGNITSKAIESMTSAIGGAITGFPNMIAGMAEAGDQAKTMATQFGLSIEEMSQLKYISEQSGVSLPLMTKNLTALGIQLQDSGSKASIAVRSIGLIPEELAKLKGADKIQAINEAIERMPPGFDAAGKYVEIFGAKGSKMASLVGEDVGALNKQFEALGGTENQQALGDLGDQFNDLSNDVKVSMDGFKRSIAVAFLPSINSVLEKMPLMGGAMLTFGSAVLDAGKAVTPMIGNMLLLTAKDKGIAGVADLLTGAGKSMTDFAKQAKGGAMALLELSAAQGGSISMFSKMGEMVKGGAMGLFDMAKSLLSIIPAMASFTMTIIANTAALLTNPYVLAAVALVALGVAIYKVVAAGRPFTEMLEDMAETVEPLTTFLHDLWTIVRVLAEKGFGYLGSWLKTVEDYLASFWQKTEEGTTWLSKLATGIADVIKWLQGLPVVGRVITDLIDGFKNFSTVVGAVWDKLKGFYSWLFKTAHDYANELTAGEQQAWWDKQQENVQTTAAVTVSATEEMIKENDRLNGIVTNLTKAQKDNYEALLKNNSAKELGARLAGEMGLSVEDATAVFDRFDKALKESAKSAKDNPFAKLMESAKDLSSELTAATATGLPFNDIVEQFGKKSADIASKAALHGALDKIDKKVVEVGRAFLQSQIKEKLDEINKKGEEAARTFGEKMSEGAKAAITSITAMQDQITESNLHGSELRIHQIEKEYKAAVAGVEVQVAGYQKEHDAAVRAAEERATLATKEITDRKLAGETITKAEEAAIANRLRSETSAADQALEINKALGKGQMKIARDVADNRLALAKKMTAYALEQEEQAYQESQNLVTLDLAQRGVLTQAAREKEYTLAKAALDKMLQAQKDGTAKFYEWEITEKQAQVKLMESEFEKEAKARGLITIGASTLVVETEKSKLKLMLDHEKDFTKDQIEEQKKRVKEAEIASGAISMSFINGLAKVANIAKQAGQAMSQLGEAMDSKILKQFGEGLQFASEMMEGLGGVMSAMAKGDTIGAIMAGISMAVKAVGKLWDAFSSSKGEKAMKDINKNFKSATGEMLEVSEEFGDKMAESAKKWFGGNQLQAQLYNLVDIIDEAGGLSEKNFEGMTKHLGDVFAQIGKGSFTVEHATKVLDENFTAFAEHTLETGKIASKGFQDIIAMNAKVGTQSKEIADFVAGQVTRLGGAFEKLLSPIQVAAERQSKALGKEWEVLDKITKDRDKLLADFAKEGPDRMSVDAKNKLADLTAEWEKQSGVVYKNRMELAATAEQAMPELQRAGRLLMASFNGATASGMSMLDAVDQLGPGLDSLIDATGNLGLTAEQAGWQWLAAFRDKVNVNRELVDSAGSLNEIMLAMANIGALDAESFADLQAQGNSTYDQLIAKGFEQGEALKMMSGYLEQARTAHEEMGLPIDENTQSLINEATAQGILKDSAVSTNDIMMQGLGAIIKALGGEMPAAFDKMSKSAVSAASTVGKALDKGPSKAVEDTSEKVDETDWEGYGEKGLAAAKLPKADMDKLAGSVKGIAEGLDTRKWDEWADAAVSAAERVQDAVDAVSLGHSPGGIKEMPIQLEKAKKAFYDWEKKSVMSAEAVEEAINATMGDQYADPSARYGGMNAAALAANRIQSIGDITVNINTESIDSSQRSREVAEEMMKEFTQILSRRVQYSVAT